MRGNQILYIAVSLQIMEALRKVIIAKKSLPEVMLPTNLQNRKLEVLIFPVAEENEEAINGSGKRVLGVLNGKIKTPDNFDEPLDELKDYM
jgi:hypothetical protein